MPLNEAKLQRIWYRGESPGWHLRALERVYTWVVRLRNRLYDLGLLKTHRLPVPVFVVGNINVGGGGKTPVVIWLVKHLQSLGHRPGVVSRGYGGKRDVEPLSVTPHTAAAASGDEPLVIARSTGAPVVVGKNRVKAAKKLIEHHNVTCIVADDGLQHRALGRDCEIAVLDAARGLGNRRMLPAGPLREPADRLDRVDLVMYKGRPAEGDLFYRFSPGEIQRLNKASETTTIGDLRSRKIMAMAGIANPDSFFSMLSDRGLAVIKKHLPDHHRFTPECFAEAADMPVLITEKDAVKCADIDGVEVWVVRMDIQPSEALRKRLDELIEQVFKS